MRLTSFLVIILLIIFTAHYLFQVRKLDRVYNESSKQMPTDVTGAIKTFEPALKIKDLDTFGKASETRKAWTSQLMRAGIELLNRPTFSNFDEQNLFLALKELGQTSILSAPERAAAQEQIVERMSQTPATLAAEGFLADFDQFIRFLERLEKEPILDAALQPRIPEILAEARKIDRYPIALRTVEFESAKAIRDGLQYLSLPVPQGPAVVALPPNANASNWNPGPAESSFLHARGVVDQFIKDWAPNPLPPQIGRLAAISRFNMAMTRLAYSVVSARTDPEGKWQMFFLPGSPPGEADEYTHRANYLVGMSNEFGGAIQSLKMMQQTDPCYNAVAQGAPAALRAMQNLTPSGQLTPIGMQLVFLY